MSEAFVPPFLASMNPAELNLVLTASWSNVVGGFVDRPIVVV